MGPRVNHRIRAKQIRVIDEDGGQLGIMEPREAMAIAEEKGLDLVEVAANAFPPVCRIMDFGRFKYEQKKKAAEAKRHSTTTQLKEVKMRPKTDQHDFDFKVRHVKRFLDAGDKVKVTIMFRGREITHQEVARRLLDRVIEDVGDLATVESQARMEGRNMFLVLAPTKTKKAPTREDGQPEKPVVEAKEPALSSLGPEVEVKRTLKKAPRAEAPRKPEPKPAPKPEPKPAPKVEAKPKPKPAPEPEPKAEAKPEPAKAPAKAAADVKTEAEPKAAKVAKKATTKKKTTKKATTKKKAAASTAKKKTTKKKTTKKKKSTKKKS